MLMRRTWSARSSQASDRAQTGRPYLLLVVASALLFLPGQRSLPLTDRDEARFAQATRQMLESHDYVVVRFQDHLRAKKPAGIYWLQSAAVSLFSTPASTAVWPYRLPSLLAALAAVLLTFRFARALFDSRVALRAAIGLATSVSLAAEAHLATTDAALLACTTLAQGSLGLIYLQSRGGPTAPGWAAPAFWFGLAAGILVKGPITPAITLLTVITLCVTERGVSWLRPARPLAGLLFTVLLVAPWMWAVSHATHGAFLTRAVQEDLLPKLLGGQEGHGAPPGTHALEAVLTLWPFSLFLWPSLAQAWHQRATAGTRFVLAWAVPSWLMFELVPTKLPHYTLPLAPAVMMMVGAWLVALPRTRQGIALWATRSWGVLWCCAGLALAFASLQMPVLYGGGFSAWALPGAAGAIATLPLAWWLLKKREDLPRFLLLAMAGGLMEVGLLVCVAPHASDLWVSQRAVEKLHQVAPGAALAVAGYAEPSIVFENGTRTQLLSAREAATWVVQAPARAALIEQRELAAFTAALPKSTALDEAAVINGLDYSAGRQVRLHLFVHTMPSFSR